MQKQTQTRPKEEQSCFFKREKRQRRNLQTKKTQVTYPASHSVVLEFASQTAGLEGTGSPSEGADAQERLATGQELPPLGAGHFLRWTVHTATAGPTSGLPPSAGVSPGAERPRAGWVALTHEILKGFGLHQDVNSCWKRGNVSVEVFLCKHGSPTPQSMRVSNEGIYVQG